MLRDERIPDEVEKLKDDLIWVWHYFMQFKKLFGKSSLRVELLNEVAPLFFYTLQRLLWFEIIMGIGRLTDPHRQGPHRNLSIAILPKLAEWYQWQFAEELQERVSTAINTAEPVRAWRKKLVAHRDLPTALHNAKRLEPIDVEQIEQMLSVLGEAIDEVYLGLTEAVWNWLPIASQDADALVHFLKMGMIYRDKIKQTRDWQEEQKDWNDLKYKDA